MCWKIFNGMSTIKPCDIFTFPNRNVNTRGHKWKIDKPRAYMEVRVRFFSVRVIKWWNKLSSDIMECTTLTQFKEKLACELEKELYAFTI